MVCECVHLNVGIYEWNFIYLIKLWLLSEFAFMKGSTQFVSQNIIINQNRSPYQKILHMLNISCLDRLFLRYENCSVAYTWAVLTALPNSPPILRRNLTAIKEQCHKTHLLNKPSSFGFGLCRFETTKILRGHKPVENSSSPPSIFMQGMPQLLATVWPTPWPSIEMERYRSVQ